MSVPAKEALDRLRGEIAKGLADAESGDVAPLDIAEIKAAARQAFVVYVDVDDTLVRSVGTKRIPIPAAVRHVRALFEQGAELYCWSSGGAEYARQSAEECGVADCFRAFLPKPHVLLDDQHPSDWRGLTVLHPSQVSGG